jgi:hypothetical protein
MRGLRGLLLLLPACGVTPYVPPDGASVMPPPACFGNNDGQIARDEVQFPLGLAVKYLVDDGSVAVTPAGTDDHGTPVWDLRAAAGSTVKLELAQPGGWSAGNFAGAAYVTTADIPSGLMGAFSASGDALLVYGFYSPQEDSTLLVYDHPIALVHFPIRLGNTSTEQGTVTNGKLNGVPVSTVDTYVVSVDRQGVLLLPYLRLENVLRVRTNLTQQLTGGLSQTRIQYSFFHECFGEVARMTSLPNETNPDFQQAAELRVIVGQ